MLSPPQKMSGFLLGFIKPPYINYGFRQAYNLIMALFEKGWSVKRVGIKKHDCCCELRGRIFDFGSPWAKSSPPDGLIERSEMFFVPDWKYFFKIWTVLAFLIMYFSLPAHSQETGDLESYRKGCAEGMTIYCIAAGMNEQKSGDLESALESYKAACENHSAGGHLRACTPYFSLARQMERLEEASARLEALCQAGDDVVCFHLAKEYFKITEYHRGFVHLERLCRENFQAPDELDAGPCYHLGSSLKKIGDLKRAENIFNFDCERDPVSAKRSCDQVEVVNLLIRQGRGKSIDEFRGFQPIESAAFGIVAIPILGLFLFMGNHHLILRFLRIPVPVLTIVCWALWESHAGEALTLRADYSFIIPAVSLALVLAWVSHLKLRDRETRDGACRTQT